MKQSAPFRQAFNPVENLQPEMEAEDEKLPDELKHKPKIPRTPAEGEGREIYRQQRFQQQQDRPQDVAPKIKGEVVKDEEKIKEFDEGFNGKDLIRRTPPENRGR